MRASGKKTKETRTEKRRKVRCLPVPEYITCPKCGFEMDLWSDVEETKCVVCGHRFFKREGTIH